MKPIVNGLEQKCSGKVVFTYLDADDSRNRATLQGFGVRSIPNFILLSPSGQEVKRWIGAVPREQFQLVADQCNAR